MEEYYGAKFQCMVLSEQCGLLPALHCSWPCEEIPVLLAYRCAHSGGILPSSAIHVHRCNNKK